MNFTLDDTSPDLGYTSGWAVQSPNDPGLSHFFQGTYHVAQTTGANVTFTFTGSYIAIYGSKGPSHASFSVQADNDVFFLSAAAPSQQFQQILFEHTFAPPSQPGSHSITLSAILDGSDVEGRWLDLDYVSFTDGSQTVQTTNIGSIIPPWQTTTPSPTVSRPDPLGGGFSASAPSITSSSQSSAPSSQSSTPSSKSSHVAVALAATFGALVGFALIFFLVWYILRRLYDARRARERRFRYGTPGPSSSRLGRPSTTTPGPGAQPPRTTPSRLGMTQVPGILSALRLGKHGKAASVGGTVASGSLYSQVPPGSPGLGSFEGVGVAVGSIEGVTVSVSLREREDTGTPASSAGAAARLLRDSPLVFGKKGKKDDGDSLRTDFLQV